MASAAAAALRKKPRTFAGLLEEYAAPAAKFPPARDIGGLEDDVATLTYEHVLRGRGRYRGESELASTAVPGRPLEPQPSRPQSGATTTQPSPNFRKSASITLRLTAEEDNRLRARATEAGMSVSAYLRSCAFEVEGLRAQVKEAVAQMKQAEAPRAKTETSWLRRLLSRAKKPA